MLSETTCPDLIGKSRLAGKKTKTIRSVIHCVLTFVVLLFAQNFSYAQIYPGSFEFEGLTREYAVFLPQNYQPNMPVVFNFHGNGGTIQFQIDYTLVMKLILNISKRDSYEKHLSFTNKGGRSLEQEYQGLFNVLCF